MVCCSRVSGFALGGPVIVDVDMAQLHEGAAFGFDVSLRLLPIAAGDTVSELDRLKEQLVYLRFWQGIMVVTEISLVGWLVSTVDTTTPTLLFFAIVGIVLLGLGIFLLHRQIERRIEQIGRL